jgi:hypothetical protein
VLLMQDQLGIAAAQARQAQLRETARRDRCCGRGAARRARKARRTTKA